MKKTLLSLLIILMLLTTCMGSAEEIYGPGATLTADFSFSSAEAVYASIGFLYDHEVLSFSGASASDYFAPKYGDGNFVFSNAAGIGNVSFSITFTVKKQAVSGTYSVIPYVLECYASNEEDTVGSISPEACSYTIESCKHTLLMTASTQATSVNNGTRGAVFCPKCGFEMHESKPIPSEKALILPTDIVLIGDEAFMNTDIAQVTIPAGCTTIGQKAFSGCTGLLCAFLPETLTSIASNAFDSCDDLLLCCTPANAYVIGWAEENGFIVNTVSMK